MRKIKYNDLIKFHREVLKKAGLDKKSIEAVTLGLCESSLRRVDSHGVRLLPHYVKSALSGRKNPKPKFTFSKKFPAIGFLDADNGFGHAAGMKAIDYCIEIANIQGIGVVGVCNSSHPGAMASFALKAARKGFIAFAFTHADSLTLSHNGKQPYFGTNPICVAIPRNEEEPFCLDMATSMISWNKLLLYKSNQKNLDENLAADNDGNPTTIPEQATCLMPAGSYKGFGLAAMVDALCGIFTGMAFGSEIPSMYKSPMEKTRNLGQFYLVMRTDGCIKKDDFLNSMQKMTNEVRNEPAQEGEKVMIAGDPQIIESSIRRKEGVPLDEATIKEFEKLSKKFGVPFSLI